MKITEIEATPILLRTVKPYRWAFGVKDGAVLVLVTVRTDEGIEGYGECIGTPSPKALCAYFDALVPYCVGQSPFRVNAITETVYRALLRAVGPSSAPRFGAQLLAGLDMALWDVVGKAAGRPVHELVGGLRHETIRFFGFVQGDTPEELAHHGARLVKEGCEVIYVKIGRDEHTDIAIVRALRAAIGDARLRVDANEAWDVLTAQRMARALEPYGIEMLEQPTDSEHPTALSHLRERISLPLGADQVVFTPADVYDICRGRAADLIVLGLHETGGITRFHKAAAIAEAAGLNVCIHGKLESGITTCASMHAAGVIPNLDDANQYMNGLLAEDVISAPGLILERGCLTPPMGPGLGFELDADAVGRAHERYLAQETGA